MTEEGGLDEGQPKKETAKRFVLRMTAPFRMETEMLGEIVARALTASASSVFAKRMPSMDGVLDADLVRVYMGSVSGLPVQDEEALPDPLTEEQVSQLTDEDVRSFARHYLEHIVKPAAFDGDVLAQMAGHIRNERQHHLELMKKTAETMRSALNIGATADFMKNWQALNKNVAGPFNTLRDEVERMMGPLNALKSSALGDALRAQEKDRANMLKAVRGIDPTNGLTSNGGSVLTPLPSPPSMLKVPPLHETLVGRTAIAVEKLGEAGERMEQAMSLVVEQAGNVSGLMGQVLSKIETEAANSQQAARQAFRLSAISLAVAALALVVSAYFSVVGYQADRQDAKSGDRSSAVMTKRVEEQTAAMTQRMDQQTAVMRELRETAEKSAQAKVVADHALTPAKSTASKKKAE